MKKKIVKMRTSYGPYLNDFIAIWLILLIPLVLLMVVLSHHPYGSVTLGAILAFVITLILKYFDVEIIK